MHCVVPAIDSFAYICEFIYFLFIIIFLLSVSVEYFMDIFIVFCSYLHWYLFLVV